jgi:hypothetical protein
MIQLLLPQAASRGSSGGCSVALWVCIITSFVFWTFLRWRGPWVTVAVYL